MTFWEVKSTNMVAKLNHTLLAFFHCTATGISNSTHYGQFSHVRKSGTGKNIFPPYTEVQHLSLVIPITATSALGELAVLSLVCS